MLTHPLHNVLVSYDVQGSRSQAIFGVLVAKAGRRDHTPKEDAKFRRSQLLHCQSTPYMMRGVQCAAAAHGCAHVRKRQASQCMHEGVVVAYLQSNPLLLHRQQQ